MGGEFWAGDVGGGEGMGTEGVGFKKVSKDICRGLELVVWDGKMWGMN